MSFAHNPFSQAFSSTGGGASSFLSLKSMTILNSVLYEPGQELYSKSYGRKTLAFTVNEICQSLIHAYGSVFEARMGGDRNAFCFDIFKRREISISFGIKGSTAGRIVEENEVEAVDLDTSLTFSKVPIPLEHSSTPETVRAFFSSSPGRQFLKEFYIEVSHDATRRLLRLDNEKTLIRNLALKAAGHPEIALKSESEIEMMKDGFFNNLLLFSGNSTFLITFGSIDFSLKVPYMISHSSVHVADSLEILVPVHPITQHLVPQISIYYAPHALHEVFDLYRKKIIVIPDPSLVQHNGFERVIYAMTQGWSILDKDQLAALMKDLYARSQPDVQIKPVPFERLLALFEKKRLVGINELFCLRFFLNAYITLLDFASEGSFEGIYLADLFHEAFSHPDYQAYFPKYVVEYYKERGDLNFLVSMECLKMQLDPRLSSSQKFTLHKGELSSICGHSSKQEGCIIHRELTIDDHLQKLAKIQHVWPDDKIQSLLSEHLGSLIESSMPLQDKVFFLLFSNQLLLALKSASINRDLTSQYSSLKKLLSTNPELILTPGFGENLKAFITFNYDKLSYSEEDIQALFSILSFEHNMPIIPLFLEVLSVKTDIDIENAIEQSLKRQKHPVHFSSLISLLLKIPEKQLSLISRFKFIEQAFKAEGLLFPLEVFYHPQILQALKLKDAPSWIDKDFWKSSIAEMLTKAPDEDFYKIYQKICLCDGSVLEITVANLNPEGRYVCLERFVKESRVDLVCLLMMHGLAPAILSRLVDTQPQIFKHTVFLNALSALPEAKFGYFIEQLISFGHHLSKKALLDLLSSSELTSHFLPHIETIYHSIDMAKDDKAFYHYLLKIVTAPKPCEHLATLGAKIIIGLNFQAKPSVVLFKQFIDKFSPYLLELDESCADPVINESILFMKKQSIFLTSLGYVFYGKWKAQCDTLKWEIRPLEENIADYSKSPSSELLFALHQGLIKKTELLSEANIQILKSYFSGHEPYYISLFHHIMIHGSEKIQDRLAKELYLCITQEALRSEFFDLYVAHSKNLKQLSSFIQAAKLATLTKDEALGLLDLIFAKASDEIKLSSLHKFKENSILKTEQVDCLFDKFTQISVTNLKKNALIDYFAGQIHRLNRSQQKDIFLLPLIAEETSDGIKGRSLLEKSHKDPKALDSLSTILQKRALEGFELVSSELLELLAPLFDHLISSFIAFDSKLQESSLRFFEKLLPLFKELHGSIPEDVKVKLLHNPPCWDLLKDTILSDLEHTPITLTLEFLDKRKVFKGFEKADHDKYLRLFKHLLESVEAEKILDLFEAYCEQEAFQEIQKKELLAHIIIKAIYQRHTAVLFRIFGMKMSLGHKFNHAASIEYDYLKTSSKASKKAIYDALSKCLSEATDFSKFNLEVLIPLKFIIDVFPEEPFLEMKRLCREKSVELLYLNLGKSTTLEELSSFVIMPAVNSIAYFEQGRDFDEFLKKVLAKFIYGESGALTDISSNLDGFESMLFPLVQLGGLKCLQNNKPLFNIISGPLCDDILALLTQKMGQLDLDVSIVNMIKLLRIHNMDYVTRLLTHIASTYPDRILNQIDSYKEEDLILLLKTLRQCPLTFYASLVSKIKVRIEHEAPGSLIKYAYHMQGLNIVLYEEFLKAIKIQDPEKIYLDLLALSFDVFINMLPKCFNKASDSRDIINLLELKRKKEGFKFFTFISKINECGSSLSSLYILNMPKPLAQECFSELETARKMFGKSILEYTSALMSKDNMLAEMFFLLHSESDVSAIIEDLKSIPSYDFFGAFMIFYQYWIMPERFQEVYPAIIENAFERIGGVLEENKTAGELEPSSIKALLECTNSLCICYYTVLDATSYPMGEKFNPLFLKSLITVLEPKNILKSHMAFPSILSSVFRSIKTQQIQDCVKAENIELVEHMFRSMVRFFVIDARDYFQQGSLSRHEFEAYMTSASMQLEIARQNMMMQLCVHWMPKILESNIDMFVPFFTMTHLFNIELISPGLKKSYYENLILICEGYIEGFKKDYAPSKSEAVIEQVMSYLQAKKIPRHKKENNALKGIYDLAKPDLTDFTFHSALLKIKEAKTHLGKK